MLRHTSSHNVTRIVLDNPPVNVMSIALMRELAGIVRRCEDKALVISASGKMFSAGVDVAEHLAPHAKEMIAGFRAVFDALMGYEGIAIAAVDGAALGGGCELVGLCDVVIASDRAQFGQPETQVGVFPPVAAVVWPRHFGYQRALDLILTGRRISAEEMHAVGLVTRVVPHTAFESVVADAIGQYARMSRTVAAHAKRACRIGAGSDVDASLRQVERLYLDSLMKTRDAEEGLRAFLEKRSPKWSDD